VAVAALACCLAALTAVLLGQLRGDFQAIGQRDAPEAGATTGLYFALNDMDAQVANEALAADAQLTSQQSHSAAGLAPASAIAYYQQATSLMQDSILPAVGSLSTVSAAKLDTAYRGGKAATGTGTAWVVIVGVLLAAATVLTIAFAAVTMARLNAESGRLDVAKRDAFDSIQSLTLAGAVGYDTGAAPSQSDGAFNQYDAALSAVIAINASAFTAAVTDGEGGAAGWEVGFPALGLVLIATLTLAGIRPRLAEYR
jgi:hypothetical protein